VPSAPAEELDSELSRTYELGNLPGAPAIVVSAFRHSGTPTGPAYAIKPDGARVRFDYSPKASFFEESLQSPADCLVIDLAQHFLAMAATTPREFPVSWIANEIRKKYFPQTQSDVSSAADAAEAILNALRVFYDENLPSKAPIDTGSLDRKLVQQVRTRAFRADQLNEGQVEQALRNGQFARYVDYAFLLDLVHRWPSVATDGRHFSLPYEGIAPELQPSALAMLVEALGDLRWLTEEASGAVSKDTAWRLRYARALASLRLVDSWVV
jgi:hypothetical protein